MPEPRKYQGYPERFNPIRGQYEPILKEDKERLAKEAKREDETTLDNPDKKVHMQFKVSECPKCGKLTFAQFCIHELPQHGELGKWRTIEFWAERIP